MLRQSTIVSVKKKKKNLHLFEQTRENIYVNKKLEKSMEDPLRKPHEMIRKCKIFSPIATHYLRFEG